MVASIPASLIVSHISRLVVFLALYIADLKLRHLIDLLIPG